LLEQPLLDAHQSGGVREVGEVADPHLVGGQLLGARRDPGRLVVVGGFGTVAAGGEQQGEGRGGGEGTQEGARSCGRHGGVVSGRVIRTVRTVRPASPGPARAVVAGSRAAAEPGEGAARRLRPPVAGEERRGRAGRPGTRKRSPRRGCGGPAEAGGGLRPRDRWRWTCGRSRCGGATWARG